MLRSSKTGVPMLSNIRIVLINTSHPGNIGSAARAMKTMGLSELYLVSPVHFPDPKADELSAGAADVLSNAVVVSELDQALEGCSLIVGTSTRSRSLPWPILSPREFAEKAMSSPEKIAVLFGREKSGLTNEELQRCHFHIQIPSNPEYSSLNLAAAVQVIGYELRVASESSPIKKEDENFIAAGAKEMEGFYGHLEKVLVDIEFINPLAPRQMMARLRRLFNRARLDEREVNILRGILKEIERNTANT